LGKREKERRMVCLQVLIAIAVIVWVRRGYRSGFLFGTPIAFQRKRHA